MPSKVGVSIPRSVLPERVPELGLIVPTSCSMPRELSVKSFPTWQKSHPRRKNTALPAIASAVIEPSELR